MKTVKWFGIYIAVTTLHFLYSMLFSLAMNAHAGDIASSSFSGRIGVEARGFMHSPQFSHQDEQNGSVFAESEFYAEWDSGTNVTIKPFLRIDSADNKRTHFDMRELVGLWIWDNNTVLRVGLSKVFWGVTESQHLVDVVNQADFIESIDGEDKLGQPMIYFSRPVDWGTIDVLFLPYFRERTFPGRDGRLRSGMQIKTDKAKFGSAAKQRHLDVAIRYSHTIDDIDFGLHYFRGTSREPSMLLAFDNAGAPYLKPFYQQIEQAGLDFQWVRDDWIYKLEAIHRSGQNNRNNSVDRYFALTGGFEYTMSNIQSSGIDLGFIMEWLYDDRDNLATSDFQDDIFLGLRLAANDTASTELLMGIIHDRHSKAKLFSIEASRRVSDNWKIETNAVFFIDQKDRDLFNSFKDDDMIKVELSYYF